MLERAVLSKFSQKLSKIAQKTFPDRQFLIRGTGHILAVRVSHRQQLIAAGLAGFALVWLLCVTAGLALTLSGEAASHASTQRLEAQLASRQARLNALIAQNIRIAQQRDAALSQAEAMQDQARRMVQATRQQQEAAISQIQASANARIAALNQQTQVQIAAVEGIIRAAGLDPSRSAANPAAPAGGAAPDGAELLQRDLGQLHALGNMLGQMPLASPVDDISITSGFGYRADPFTGLREFHVGIDLRGPLGAPIYATAPGTVTFAGTETGYGLLVEIDHGYGLSTRYSHLDRILVQVGEKVGLHQTVGLMGNTGWSTGPHLLYETRVDGQPDNPLHFIKVSANDVQN
jgi:murein DD-endopeptidase MepM/ murein hydrolase activator NlpD